MGGISPIIGVGEPQLESLARGLSVQLTRIGVFDAKVNGDRVLCDGGDGVAAQCFFDQPPSCR
jgi:hypothetical protein